MERHTKVVESEHLTLSKTWILSKLIYRFNTDPTLELDNVLLAITAKAHATREKINGIVSKLKTFVFQQTLSRKWKQPTGQEKMYTNHISDKRPISRIFKELLATKQWKHPVKTRINDLNRHMLKEDKQIAETHMERWSAFISHSSLKKKKLLSLPNNYPWLIRQVHRVSNAFHLISPPPLVCSPCPHDIKHATTSLSWHRERERRAAPIPMRT